MSASVVEAKPVLKWRVVDIAVASVIGVASALIYWAVAFFSAAPWSVLEAVVPGLAGIFNGLWLFAGPLAAVHRAQTGGCALCGSRGRRA